MFTTYTPKDLRSTAREALAPLRCLAHNRRFRLAAFCLRVGDRVHLVATGICHEGCGRDVSVAL